MCGYAPFGTGFGKPCFPVSTSRMDSISRWLNGEDPKPLTATLVADSVRAIEEHMLTENAFVWVESGEHILKGALPPRTPPCFPIAACLQPQMPSPATSAEISSKKARILTMSSRRAKVPTPGQKQAPCVRICAIWNWFRKALLSYQGPCWRLVSGVSYTHGLC